MVLKLDALGDHILWLSSGAREVASYARRSAGRSVLLARPELSEFLKTLGFFDDVWAVDPAKFRRKFTYRLRIQIRVRRAGFAQVLQMRFARQYLIEDTIVRAAGSRDVRGVLGDSHGLEKWEARVSDKWYRPIVQLNGEVETHELLRNRQATVALTGREPVPFTLPPVPLPASLRLPRRYVVLAPGAGSPQRRWPPERFSQIIESLRMLAPSHRCVLVGSSDETALGEAIAAGTSVVNLCGQLTVAQLVEVVRCAALVVANESAPGHIAAYCRVPSVIVLGGGHFGWFMPYPPGWEARLTAPRTVSFPMDCFGCNWQCRFTRSRNELVPCVREVTAGAVARTLAECWAQTSAGGQLPTVPAHESASL